MATIPLNVSKKEQCAVIRFFWAKRLTASTINKEMSPIYGEKCFTRPAVHCWCEKFSKGRESIVDDKRSGREVVATNSDVVSRIEKFIRSWRICRKMKDLC